MPPLADLFGSLERLLGELYAYRLPLGVLALLAVVAAVLVVRRRGVDRALARWIGAHRRASLLAGVAALAVAIPLGNYTLSPLWERSALNEASPLEVSAVPPTVTPASTGAPTSASGSASRPTSLVAPLATAPPPSATASSPVAPATAPASASPASVPSAGPRVLREGTLRGADAFHFGRGRVLLIDGGDGRRVLRLEGLSVRNGPDLFVYLAPRVESVEGAVNLGALKATDGSFNYDVPAGLDAAALDQALIWCRQFGVLFASAPLSQGS